MPKNSIQKFLLPAVPFFAEIDNWKIHLVYNEIHNHSELCLTQQWRYTMFSERYDAVCKMRHCIGVINVWMNIVLIVDSNSLGVLSSHSLNAFEATIEIVWSMIHC